MTEVDEIEQALRGPVNCWLNSNQQLLFQRLVQIARTYYRLTAAEAPFYERTEDSVEIQRDRFNNWSPDDPRFRQPSVLTDDPAFYAMRNRPGSSY